MELSQLAAQGLVDFAAPGAAWFIAEIVLGTTPSDRLSHWQRPSWDTVTDDLLKQKRPLWEALAKA